MSEQKSENPPSEGGLSCNMDDGKRLGCADIVSNPLVSVKQSRINKLFEILVPYRSDDAGNHWAECPFCGSPDQFSFNIKKYCYWCYRCQQGRHKTLRDLMAYLKVDDHATT